MKITIYTITDCQFSKQEKEYLTAHNLPFEEKNLETNHEYLTEMLNVSNNFAGTPVTKLEKDDGNIIVLKGFTAEEFDKELGFKKEEEKPADQKDGKPEEAKLADAQSQQPEQPQANAAPPTTPPEPSPMPQPPSPVPQPPTAPQPETPIAPPTIPDQSAQMPNVNAAPAQDMGMPQQPMNQALPPLDLNQAPSIPQEQPQAPQQPQEASNVPSTDGSIDDASLDAILNQLQQKTGDSQPAQAQQPQQPQAGSPPNIPDFGGNQ